MDALTTDAVQVDTDIASPILDEVACAVPLNDPRTQGSWYERRLADGKHCVNLVINQAWTLALLLKHPQAPWRAKAVAGCTVAYLVSPIQLIPSFIPVIGQLDDVFVLFLGMKLLRKWVPSDILAACEAQAGSSISALRVSKTSAKTSPSAADS